MHSNDSNSLSLNILNYSGPLDTLLELAKSQKVDLNQISVTELADQFHNFLSKSTKINFNLVATSRALNSSSSVSGKSNFDLRYVSQVAIRRYSDAKFKLSLVDLVKKL